MARVVSEAGAGALDPGVHLALATAFERVSLNFARKASPVA